MTRDEYSIRARETARRGTAITSAKLTESDVMQAREHLRRGHIRNLQKGKRIWINSCVVNAGVGGRISKAYAVKGASQ